MSTIPPIAVSMVGSWPRSKEVLRAQRDRRNGKLSDAAFNEVADRAVLEMLRLQDEAGIDVVTDGEQRRDNFYSFVAQHIGGVQLMTLAEMLGIIEDKVTFERILQTLDVPAYSISNPTCIGKISRKSSLALDELRFLKKHTNKPVKIPLPGPYILTRAMFVREVTAAHYPSKEALGEDVVRVLKEEIAELIDAGADLIQLDEPALTELVFTQGHTRTFMCAALAATNDPTQDLELAVSLINRVIEGIDPRRICLHICRGNWSQDESTLLTGSYHPLKDYLERLNLSRLVLEYATDRAGDLMRFTGKGLGLGVVNPRTERVESVAEITSSIERALTMYGQDELMVNPDCGFGTFSNRPVNSSDIAFRKMKAITEAVRALRR